MRKDHIRWFWKFLVKLLKNSDAFGICPNPTLGKLRTEIYDRFFPILIVFLTVNSYFHRYWSISCTVSVSYFRTEILIFGQVMFRILQNLVAAPDFLHSVLANHSAINNLNSKNSSSCSGDLNVPVSNQSMVLSFFSKILYFCGRNMHGRSTCIRGLGLSQKFGLGPCLLEQLLGQ